MKTAYIEKQILYDSLYSHFAYKNFDVRGDSIVAFRGACKVIGESLVDLEDRNAGTFIEAKEMLHFVVEHFGIPLREIVTRQRLLILLVAEIIHTQSPAANVRRDGDDLFVGDGKLSVSIATVSAVSGIIHLGINIDGGGAPVQTAELGDLNINVGEFAAEVMTRYTNEICEIEDAMSKVIVL